MLKGVEGKCKKKKLGEQKSKDITFIKEKPVFTFCEYPFLVLK